MKKTVKWICRRAAGGGRGAVFNPALTNPPVGAGEGFDGRNAPPAEIAALLHNACYDCHSYATKWPWYSHVAPVSWFVAGHVNDAREAMNFSEWPHDDAYKAGKRLNQVGRQVQDGQNAVAQLHLDAPGLAPDHRTAQTVEGLGGQNGGRS